MNQDYCEILLQAMNIIAENTASNSIISTEENNNSNSNELHLSLADPFDKMIQQNRIDLINERDIINNVFIWNSFPTNKYDLLGIECTITTSLDPDTKFTGEYGIYFTVVGSNNIYKGSLSSTEMLGRVDKFTNMLQKKIFDLSNIINIASVRLEFYNTSTADVTFDNVSLRIGYSTNTIGETSEPLIIYGEETPLEYTSNHLGQIVEGGAEILTVRWIYKEGYAYRAITYNNYSDMPENASIRWYHYTPNSPWGDQYGGPYWSLMPLEEDENPFQRLVTNFDASAEGEYYKVVILQENLETNELTVAAETFKEDCFIKNTILGVTEQLTDRKLELLDGTNGVYNYYAFDQLITPNNQWRVAEERTAIISFNTIISEESFYKQLRKVEWKIPADQMFYCGEYENATIDGNNGDGYFHLIYTNFTETDNYIEAINKLMSIKYYINERRIQDAPNKIECIISLSDGIDYKFEKEVNFSVLGSGGTDTSVIIRMTDENGNLRSAIQPGEELYLHLQVFDPEGQDITKTIKQISWTQLYKDSYIKLSDGGIGDFSRKISTTEKDVPGIPEKITDSTDVSNWISVIKVSVVITSYEDEEKKNRLIEIQEIIDIPVAEVDKLNWGPYKGPKTIRYDSSNSNPSYDKSKIELTGTDKTLLWKIIPEELPFTSYPALRDNQIYPKNSLDTSILNTPLALEAYTADQPEEVVWIQPIIIVQNKYFSSIINQWDESLQISQDGNYILASSYVAGSKNENNTFTGLIMGELGNISDEDSAQRQIGLFGYKDGIQSFVLDSNGNAEFSGKITAMEGSNIAGWETTKNIFGKLGPRYSTELDGNITKNYYYGIGLNSLYYNLGKQDFYPLAIGPLTALENGDWSKAFFKVDGTGGMFASKGAIGAWNIGTLESFDENTTISFRPGNKIFTDALYSRIEIEDENKNRYLLLRASPTSGSHTAFGVLQENYYKDGTNNKHLLYYDEGKTIGHVDVLQITNEGNIFQNFLISPSNGLQGPDVDQPSLPYMLNQEWAKLYLQQGNISQRFERISYGRGVDDKYEKRREISNLLINNGELQINWSNSTQTLENLNTSEYKWNTSEIKSHGLAIGHGYLTTQGDLDTQNDIYYINTTGTSLVITTTGNLLIGPKYGLNGVTGDNKVPRLTMSENQGNLTGTWKYENSPIINEKILKEKYGLQPLNQ